MSYKQKLGENTKGFISIINIKKSYNSELTLKKESLLKKLKFI